MDLYNIVAHSFWRISHYTFTAYFLMIIEKGVVLISIALLSSNTIQLMFPF